MGFARYGLVGGLQIAHTLKDEFKKYLSNPVYFR